MTAVVVPDRTWRAFGEWSGIRVEALLSHAFLKHYAWTIDFDRRVYLLHDRAGQAVYLIAAIAASSRLSSASRRSSS